MRGLVGFATLVVMLGIAIGCSNNPPPIKEAEKVGGDGEVQKSPDVPSVQKPEKSDPAALAVVEAAIKAYTGGKPELLQAFKSVKANREGQGVGMANERLDQKWLIQMIWPDKIRLRVEMSADRYSIIVRSGETIWSAGSANREKQIAEPKLTAAFIQDASAEWLLLLFPLTEPTTIFAPAPDGRPNQRPATGVRIWAKDITDAVLYFDKETKLLAQVTYDGREGTQKVAKDFVIVRNKAFSGVLLPERIELRSNGRYLYDWSLIGIEPTTAIDPKVFENP